MPTEEQAIIAVSQDHYAGTEYCCQSRLFGECFGEPIIFATNFFGVRIFKLFCEANEVEVLKTTYCRLSPSPEENSSLGSSELRSERVVITVTIPRE